MILRIIASKTIIQPNPGTLKNLIEFKSSFFTLETAVDKIMSPQSGLNTNYNTENMVAICSHLIF